MEDKEKYSKIQNHTNNGINWISEIFIDLKNISKKWFLSIWDFIKLFFSDLKSKDKNWKYKVSSIIAFGIVVWFSFYLPIKSIYEWGKWEYRESKIKYLEIEIPTKTEVEKEIENFGSDYSRSFGVSCDWFKKHDVDIAMYDKYKRLERTSYECASFNRNTRALMFPLEIGLPYGDNLIVSVNVKFGKIYYDSTGAKQYTTVDSKLWKLKDESNFWRIDKMKNIQRHDF